MYIQFCPFIRISSSFVAKELLFDFAKQEISGTGTGTEQFFLERFLFFRNGRNAF